MSPARRGPGGPVRQDLGDGEPVVRQRRVTWDLYVVVLIGIAATEASHLATAEAIEGDTRYARKFVHVGLERDALDRALRPLLPLRAPTALEVEDPLGELRAELRMLNLADELVDAAIGTFRDTNVVSIP